MGTKVKVIDPSKEIWVEVIKEFEVELEDGTRMLCRVMSNPDQMDQTYLVKPVGSDEYIGSWDEPVSDDQMDEIASLLFSAFHDGDMDSDGEIELED